MRPQKVLLVLSGGLALGAYQAGAYAALHEHANVRPEHIAGCSIGAVNGALIAGNQCEKRVQRLHEFWDGVAVSWLPWQGAFGRHASNWMEVLRTRLFGCPGVFHPRAPELMLGKATTLYDLAPLQARINRLVDFERLNGGAVRISVITTDIETGEKVVFDTRKGDRIASEHLIASCGFLPDFAPVEIGGRLLGDGALIANAPVESALLDEESERDLLCFVVDLFAPHGQRPATLEQAAARRWDLMLGGQTQQALSRLERDYRLRRAANRRRVPNVKLAYLSYRAGRHEAAPEKQFDFSRASLAERWQTGYLDMGEAIRLASQTSGRQARGERGVVFAAWS